MAIARGLGIVGGLVLALAEVASGQAGGFSPGGGAPRRPGRAKRRAPQTARPFVVARQDEARAKALYEEALGLQKTGDLEEAHERYRQILDEVATFSRVKEVIDREYEVGLAFLEGKAERSWLGIDWTDEEFGADILTYLLERFEDPRFDYPRYLVAELQMREGDYEEAADGFLRLEEDHPRSDWLPASRFLRAICYLRLCRGYNYDDRSVRKAEELLLDYLRRYPEGDRKEAAEAALHQIRENRAELYLDNAVYYLRREEKPRAAMIYLASILQETPKTKAAAEVPALLREVVQRKDVDPTSAARAQEALERLAQARRLGATAPPADQPRRLGGDLSRPPVTPVRRPSPPGAPAAKHEPER